MSTTAGEDKDVKAERQAKYAKFHRLLNTEDGQTLMAELKSVWASGNPLDTSAQVMGFNVGLTEAYKQLEIWQSGALFNDERSSTAAD